MNEKCPLTERTLLCPPPSLLITNVIFITDVKCMLQPCNVR